MEAGQGILLDFGEIHGDLGFLKKGMRFFEKGDEIFGKIRISLRLKSDCVEISIWKVINNNIYFFDTNLIRIHNFILGQIPVLTFRTNSRIFRTNSRIFRTNSNFAFRTISGTFLGQIPAIREYN